MRTKLKLPRWLPFRPKAGIHYVCDGAGWVIDSEGAYITRGVASQFQVRTTMGTDVETHRRSVVHFGSQHSFTGGGFRHVHPSNQVAVTFFHGDAEDPAFASAIEVFLRESARVGRVIVSCRIMRDRMLRWGIPDEKVVMVPIGVDLNVFLPPTPAQRMATRQRLGIQPDQIVIGSFQKDGVGWGEGLEPKLIKGPDIFLDVIARLHKEFRLFVLLTGPARGFMCRGLERLHVPYRREQLEHYQDVASSYHALDLYLVTAREEGGPKGVMEAMATGVPLVSSRVGMAADLIHDGENGFLCEIGDVAALAQRTAELAASPSLRSQLAAGGRCAVLQCDFPVVVRQHFEQVYRPLQALL